MRKGKLVGLGLLNYLIRFLIAGALFQGVGMDPVGIPFGVIITLVSFVAAFLLLRFLVKPNSQREAWKAGLVWVVLALLLDAITGMTLLKLPLVAYFSEWQVWTRAVAILVAAFLSVRQSSSVSPLPTRS